MNILKEQLETNALKQKIENLLKTVPDFITENNELKINLIKDKLDNYDPMLIELLLKDNEIKKSFSTPILDSYVFKIKEFKEFLDYSYACNSYSKYLGKEIGLYMGDTALTDRNEVVLNFPFKDCVLEGGQKKEDGLDTYFEWDKEKEDFIEKKAKRREVFYNEILAQDEIDSLFSPKALANCKRFTIQGEEDCINFNRDAEINKKRGLPEDTITDNLIIKGNNLLALHSLKQQFAGKVKLIYIDPPYNTGSDSFVYNDNFNHSSWLTFMKNRLEIARELLKEDGSIFVQCDDNEQAYLKVLMDSVFSRIRYINTIIWKRKFGNANETRRLGTAYDSILVYSKSENYYFKLLKEKDSQHTKEYITQRFTRKDENGKHKGKLWMPYPLANPGKPTKNLIYEYKGYKAPPKGWRMIKEKLAELDADDRLYFPEDKNQRIQEKKFLDEYDGQPIDSLWTDIYVINSQSTEACDFDGQKPEQLLKRILELTTLKHDIVIDFHLGSGTTAAVAHKMERQYIGIEQMDYIKKVSIDRLKNIIEGEKSGISNNINWQGGGSFIYFELAEKNEKAIRLISACKNHDELISIFDTLCKKYFLHYNVKIKQFRNEICKSEQFKNLKLERQKEMFIRMLDLNQLYVNCDERNDESNGLSENDIKITEDFYQINGVEK